MLFRSGCLARAGGAHFGSSVSRSETGETGRDGGLVALLIAVFPANLYMAMHPAEAGAASIAPVLRWGRLPLQALLIWWLLWCTRARFVLR